MERDIPLFEITIDPEFSEGNELGIEEVAFTHSPAIKTKGFFFKSEEQKQFFSDGTKMRIVAPAMIPSTIYRRDEEDGSEYYTEFTVEEVDRIHNKFMSQLNNVGKFNLEHDQEKKVPAFILEAWTVDEPKKDKAFSSYGINVPKGTLMLIAQVTDKEYFNKLVENDQLGFSIEGYFGLKTKQKKEKMKIQLPDGEHIVDGKKYTVLNGEFSSVEDVEAEKKEELADETEEEESKEELADETEDKEAKEEETQEEETSEEMADETEEGAEALTEETVGLMIDAKIEALREEFANLLAEIKTEMMETETEAAETTQEKMSAQEKFNTILKWHES